MGYIYCITNLVNGKQYIGMTTQYYKKRWQNHLYCIKNNGGCPLLLSAIKKYGLDNFKFEIMIICFDESLSEMEKLYIARYNTVTPNGYNISKGGEASYGFLGKKHSDETKQKLRDIFKKMYEDNPSKREENRQRVNKAFAENGDKIKQKIKDGLANSERWQAVKYKDKGVPKSAETKAKISEAMKNHFDGKGKTKDAKAKHKEILQKALGKAVEKISLEDGSVLGTYKTIAEAAKENNMSAGGIGFVLSGQRKQSKGYMWRYKKDENTST